MNIKYKFLVEQLKTKIWLWYRSTDQWRNHGDGSTQYFQFARILLWVLYFLDNSECHNADNGCQGKVSLLFNIFHPQLQDSTLTNSSNYQQYQLSNYNYTRSHKIN